MGGCFSTLKAQVQNLCLSCCFPVDADKSQTGEPTERTTLLGNPVSNSHSRPLFGDTYSSEVGAPSTQVPDEQAALNRILQQTACDIIDVSAIPAHLERKEYMDRVKTYQQKLQDIQYHPGGLEQKPLLRDLSYPEKVLAENPLTLADFRMLEETFGDMYRALQDVKVQPHSDLVAQFGSS